MVKSIIFNWDINEFYNMVKSCEYDDAIINTLNYIEQDDMILEAGCGTGRVVKYLSDLNYNITGVEYSPKSVTDINQLEPSLDIKCGDICELDTPDNTYDKILSYGVIEHFINGPEVPLQEMKRVLKPGGQLIITVPSLNIHRQASCIKGIDDLYYKFTQGNRFYEYRMTPIEFETAITNNGFKILYSLPVNNMDGMYHDKLAPMSHDGIKIIGTPLSERYNDTYKNAPFNHNHMHLIVCEK